MAQFLLITTLLTIAGLIATMVMGFLATPVHAAQHILAALLTVLIGLFSQSMTMFFFIGSGKQLKDHVKGTEHEAAVRQRVRDLKNQVFPVATYATLVLMVTFILGGGVATGKTPWWLHLASAVASLLMFGRAYWKQINAMVVNADLMETYLGAKELKIEN